MSDLVYTEVGRGLVVCEAPVEAQSITRALKQLSDRLFLELHLTQGHGYVWTVQEHVGENAGGSPYRTVLYWTDGEGIPLPLTWRIVDKVKQLEGDAVVRITAAKEEGLRRRQAALAEVREAAAEMAGEVQKAMRPGHSAVLPRGVGLRMARDRRRARGENC